MSAGTFTRSSSASAAIGRQSLRGLIVRFGGLALGQATAIVLARHLGAEQFGVYAASLSLATLLATLLICGTDRHTAKSIAAIPDSDGDAITDDTTREVSASHAVGLLAIATGLIGLAIAHLTLDAFPWTRSAATVVGFTMLILPVLLLFYVRQWTALPLVGTAGAILPEQILHPVLLLGLIVLHHAMFGVLTTSAAAGAFAVAGLVAWWIGARDRRVAPLLRSACQQNITRRQVYNKLNSGRPFLVANVTNVAMVRMTPLLVALFCGFEDSALLAVAMQLAALVAMPLNIVNLTVMPPCARYHSQGDRAGVSHVVRLGATICFALAIPIAAGLVVCSDEIVSLFGPEFEAAGSLLLILVVAPVANALCGPNGSAMQMVGLESLYSRILLVANGVQVAAIAVAASSGSLTAIAITIVVVRIGWNVALCLVLWQRYQIAVLPYLRPAAIARHDHHGGRLALGGPVDSPTTTNPRAL